MSVPTDLLPAPGERGVLSADPEGAGARALRAWDLFADAVGGVDQSAPSRSRGRSARDVLLPLGAWPQTRSVDEVVADARNGRTEPAIDLDEVDAAALAANPGAGDADVLAALVGAREQLAAYLGSSRAAASSGLTTASPLGALPVLTLLHATAYRLSVAALDVEPCGATPSDELLELGVAALVDTTGALAAREGVDGSITALMPGSAWGFGAVGGSWRSAPVVASPDTGATGPSVRATARVIVDVTAGRVTNVAGLWRDGRLETHDLPGLLRVVPVLEHVPGLPGGAALRAAARYLGGLGRLLGRLPGISH